MVAYILFASPVRSPRSGGTLQAPLLPSTQVCPKKKRFAKEITKERRASVKDTAKNKGKKTTVQRLRRSCRPHKVVRGHEQWSLPGTAPSAPAPSSSSHSPHLQLRQRTYGIILLGWHPPSHICGGEEVQYCPPTPLVR